MKEGDLLVGYGMATATYPANRSASSAKIQLFPDGHAVIYCATQDIGTGTYTILTQIAAQGLGLPMASVLFGAHASLAVLPLMLFHQMQLMVCAVIAKRRAHDPGVEGEDADRGAGAEAGDGAGGSAPHPVQGQPQNGVLR